MKSAHDLLHAGYFVNSNVRILEENVMVTGPQGTPILKDVRDDASPFQVPSTIISDYAEPDAAFVTDLENLPQTTGLGAALFQNLPTQGFLHFTDA
jgi:hypothetical protein